VYVYVSTYVRTGAVQHYFDAGSSYNCEYSGNGELHVTSFRCRKSGLH